jgi:hypothetical protein
MVTRMRVKVWFSMFILGRCIGEKYLFSQKDSFLICANIILIDSLIDGERLHLTVVWHLHFGNKDVFRHEPKRQLHVAPRSFREAVFLMHFVHPRSRYVALLSRAVFSVNHWVFDVSPSAPCSLRSSWPGLIPGATAAKTHRNTGRVQSAHWIFDAAKSRNTGRVQSAHWIFDAARSLPKSTPLLKCSVHHQIGGATKQGRHNYFSAASAPAPLPPQSSSA